MGRRKKRVPVGYAIARGQYPLVHHHANCICSDGSYWKWDHQAERWRELSPIPGSAREAELARDPDAL